MATETLTRGNAMPVDYRKLAANSVDLAAAVSEPFLNSFAKAHFKHDPAVYQGSYKFTGLPNDISLDYKVQNALAFDLTPISPSRFKKIWGAHMKAKGAIALVDPMTPPNLKMTSKKVKFVFTVFKGHTSTVDFTVDFEWDLKALCAVQLVDAGTSKAIRLEPISIEFTLPKPLVLKEIRRKLTQRSKRRKSAQQSIATINQHLAASGPSDPVWCTKVEELLLFILNNILTVQFSNFVRQFELPRAIDIFRGVKVEPFYLDVSDDTLVVGGHVIYTPSIRSEVDERVSGFLSEFQERLNSEFSGLSDARIQQWDPATSPTMKWINGQITDLKNRHGSRKTPRTGRYPQNLILLSNDRLFDAIANSSLRATGGNNYGAEIDHIVKAEAGWWYTVGNGHAHVVPKGIDISASAALGGYARVCYFDIDPKNFGKWKCIGLCVILLPEPHDKVELEAYPSFANDGIYLDVNLLNKSIKLQFCGDVPGWANAIIGWISQVLTAPLIQALSLFIAMMHPKIGTYPRYFPGTGLEYEPRLNTTLDNNGPYLTFSGDPDFK
jgi:hypothetical protein